MPKAINQAYDAWRAAPTRQTEALLWSLVTQMALRIARRYLRGEAARDAAQDAAVRLWQQADRFRGGSFEGHAYRMALWTARSACRRQRWERARFEVPTAPDGTYEEPADAHAPSTSARLDAERVLTRLSASHRDVLVAVYLRGERRADVARLTGRAPSVIHRRCEKALHLARAACGAPAHA